MESTSQCKHQQTLALNIIIIKVHTIVLIAICDYNYRFTLLDIGDYCRQSDGGVFSNSFFGRAIENNFLSLPNPNIISGQNSPTPYFFVGDSTFPLKMYML